MASGDESVSCIVSFTHDSKNVVCFYAFFSFRIFCRLRRKIERKPLVRHASTIMSQIDAIMMDEQADKALDCVSVRSSRFSIPSLHLSSLSLNWVKKEDSHL